MCNIVCSTYMKIEKELLKKSSYRDRYLQELEEHREDGDEKSLGNPEELIETFNMYVKTSRDQKRIFAAKVALAVLALAVFSQFFAFSLPPAIGMPLLAINRILYFPILLIFYFPLIHTGVLPVEAETLTPGMAILGILGLTLQVSFWTLLITFLRYPPQKLMSMFKRN